MVIKNSALDIFSSDKGATTVIGISGCTASDSMINSSVFSSSI
nr:hypothetical protein [Flavobacterium covae]